MEGVVLYHAVMDSDSNLSRKSNFLLVFLFTIVITSFVVSDQHCYWTRRRGCTSDCTLTIWMWSKYWIYSFFVSIFGLLYFVVWKFSFWLLLVLFWLIAFACILKSMYLVYRSVLNVPHRHLFHCVIDKVANRDGGLLSTPLVRFVIEQLESLFIFTLLLLLGYDIHWIGRYQYLMLNSIFVHRLIESSMAYDT